VSEWPKGTTRPGPQDTVQVLMTETMARAFERHVLGVRGSLAGPLLFSTDDVPTYIIGVKPQPKRAPREARNIGGCPTIHEEGPY
jgi:hypothetical protein